MVKGIFQHLKVYIMTLKHWLMVTSFIALAAPVSAGSRYLEGEDGKVGLFCTDGGCYLNLDPTVQSNGSLENSFEEANGNLFNTDDDSSAYKSGRGARYEYLGPGGKKNFEKHLMAYTQKKRYKQVKRPRK